MPIPKFTPIHATTLLFVGLKLSEVIDWSWWWVLSPLWIGFIVGGIWGMTKELRRQLNE